MIPIEYDDLKLKKYNDFIDTFLVYMDKYLNNGYVGRRNRWKVSDAKEFYDELSSEQKTRFNDSADRESWYSLGNNDTFLAADLPMDIDTINFFTEAKRELKTWVNLRPDGIKTLSDRIVADYAGFNDHDTTLYRIIYKMFVDKGYKDMLPKDNLIEAAGADVCPYCNRVFIKNIDGNDKKQVKGQLDHFYDKAQYPYLAILKYNLIPSCPFCNGPTGKHSIDAEKEGLISPFMLKDVEAMKFHVDIKGSGFVDMNTCADAISVKVTYNKNEMENNARIFHLEELYNSHTDYAAEMYFRNQMIHSEAYRKFVSDFNLDISSEDWHRMIFGFSDKVEDICKRPISKFCKDILEEFEKYT